MDNIKYPLALPQGSILSGQFIIEKVLGQGGFGITYQARDHKSGNKVAIKEYFPDTMVTRAEKTRVIPYTGERGEFFSYGKSCFLQEAETLARFIGNENIVRIYSYFEENGTAYFVMDFVEGTSFDQYIRQNGGCISYEEAERLLLPVIDALSVVHSKGIVHRDVTPDNIYITNEDKVILLDFGAARYSLGDKSRSLDVVLKHGFAPREQYARHGKQGPFTDVYALGATFYYAITGRRPPDSIERMEEDTIVAPSSMGVKIPHRKEDALLTALNVSPGERYQSMPEFKQELLGYGNVQRRYGWTSSHPDDDKTEIIGQNTAPVTPALISLNDCVTPDNVINNSGNPVVDMVSPLLRRAMLFLEDSEWKKADEYCEKVLDLQPENAWAYLGKLMAEIHVKHHKDLASQTVSYADNKNFQKAMRFADEGLKARLEEYLQKSNSLSNAREIELDYEKKYREAVLTLRAADTKMKLQSALLLLKKVSGYKDADSLAAECQRKIEEKERAAVIPIAGNETNANRQPEPLEPYHEVQFKGKESKRLFTPVKKFVEKQNDESFGQSISNSNQVSEAWKSDKDIIHFIRNLRSLITKKESSGVHKLFKSEVAKDRELINCWKDSVSANEKVVKAIRESDDVAVDLYLILPKLGTWEYINLLNPSAGKKISQWYRKDIVE